MEVPNATYFSSMRGRDNARRAFILPLYVGCFGHKLLRLRPVDEVSRASDTRSSFERGNTTAYPPTHPSIRRNQAASF